MALGRTAAPADVSGNFDLTNSYMLENARVWLQQLVLRLRKPECHVLKYCAMPLFLVPRRFS